ncbi:MAG: NAD(P)H-dependent oxidoreductase [Cellulosilyticaceae bacterium]
MKILLLVANCSGEIFEQVAIHIQKVLGELDVEVEEFDLLQLPYFRGQTETQMANLSQKLSECKGVVVCSQVNIGGMHGAMQTFFDHMGLWHQSIKGQPLFVVTYTNWTGEVKCANEILSHWELLGGVDGGKICLNQNNQFEEAIVSLERSIEGFYRMIKQARVPLVSNERRMFLEHFTPTQEQPKVNHIDLSTEEQNIRELTALLKGQMQKPEEEQFIQYQKPGYQRPQTESSRVITKKLQGLPHYFVAKHDKVLDFSVQFTVTDTAEEGLLTIQDGDCIYQEGKSENATLEIVTTDRILSSILSGEMTYQKAFMLGRIKVKGNFIYLSKIDQVFKSA